MTDSNINNQSFLNKNRKDKFIMVLSLPKAFIRSFSDLNIRELQLSVYGTPVPKISIPSTEAGFFGHQLKVTTQSRLPYDPISVSFTVDNEFKNYWILWKWLDLINDSRDSGMNEYFSKYQEIKTKDNITQIDSSVIVNKDQGMSIYHDYMTDMTIYGLDEYNNKRIKFIYKQAFITDLSELSYNYRVPDEMESTATFAFSQLHAELTRECSNTHSAQ